MSQKIVSITFFTDLCLELFLKGVSELSLHGLIFDFYS